MDEHKADILSNLPGEILLRIISFLPFESAIQTVFLSKRWRNFWNGSLVQRGAKEEIPSAVSCFIHNFNEYDPMKNTRKLNFHFDNGNTLVAIIAPNNTLHLRFSSLKTQESSRDFLLQLELDSHDQFLTRNPVSSTFFVRSLCLISMNHLTNEAVSSMFSDFNFLEILKIINCPGLTSLSTDSKVKLLSLTVFDCSQLKLIKIKSFKLKTLRYRGFCPLFNFRHHFNLEEAMFDCRQGTKHSVSTSVDMDPVLLAIKNAKILTFCGWVFEALICKSLSTFRTNFQFYRLKELWWIDNSLKRDNICSLISFLRLCPSLEHLFITIDPKTYSAARTVALSENVGKHTRLEDLRLVKLEGLTSHQEVTSLAKALQEIVTVQPIITSSFSDNSGIRKSLKLSQSDKSKWRHEFLDVKDTKDSCPKHVHMSL